MICRQLKIRLAIAIAASVSSAACQDRAAAPVPTTGDVSPVASPKISGADAARRTGEAVASFDLEPQEMRLADWKSVNLRGELGCDFSRGGDGPLLFATSFVDPEAPADAAVKLAGQVVRLTTAGEGGFDNLVKGARFAEPGGLVVNVVRISDKAMAEQPPIAEESPRYAAMMVVSKAGRELAVDGFWKCGP